MFDILQGDSGDPLLMQYVADEGNTSAVDFNSKPWYLLGIVSFGTCGEDNPTIFTRFKIQILLFRPNWSAFSFAFSFKAVFLRTESFIPWIWKNIRD